MTNTEDLAQRRRDHEHEVFNAVAATAANFDLIALALDAWGREGRLIGAEPPEAEALEASSRVKEALATLIALLRHRRAAGF